MLWMFARNGRYGNTMQIVTREIEVGQQAYDCVKTIA